MVEDRGNISTRRRGVRSLSRWLRRLQWVIIPTALFLSLEWVARHWQRVQPPVQKDVWAAKEQTIRPDVPVTYAFIGSSRVAAAVDEKTFENIMARELEHPVQAINFGYGYTCMVQHYLNLRNLGRSHAEQMRGCVVFVEAFGGMPQAQLWTSRWFDPGWSHLLLPLLRQEDLPRLWATPMTPEERLRLNEDVRNLTDVFTRHCALLKNRDRLSNECMALGQRWFDKAVLKIARRRPVPAAPVADLKTAGGVRNDQDGVQLARKVALDWVKIMLANQGPVRLGEDSVEFSLIQLVKSMGGQVVFYETPISSVQAVVYDTPVRREDRRIFREQLSKWGALYLTPDFVAQDSDIPDYWHLSASRAPDFTRVLAKAWTEASLSKVTALHHRHGEETRQ